MNWISLICLFLIAICVAAPVSAFVDRNGVTSAAQFRDNVPASYLAKAGVTDGMTVDRALDAYITYALSFSSPTAYAYIAQLTNPSDVKIRAGGSTAPASRGDVVAEGWNIEVGDGTLVAIRYPGGVMHTITGPYTYTVPAYQKWGASATFGTAPVGTNSKAFATLPDTSGYAVVTRQIECRGMQLRQAYTVIVNKGTVYAVHYTRDPTLPEYVAFQIREGGKTPLGDSSSIITAPGSSVTIEMGFDLIKIPEKTIFELIPKSKECIREGGIEGGIREKTIFDTFKFDVVKPIHEFLVGDLTEWDVPSWMEFWDLPKKLRTTVTAGVRG